MASCLPWISLAVLVTLCGQIVDSGSMGILSVRSITSDIPWDHSDDQDVYPNTFIKLYVRRAYDYEEQYIDRTATYINSTHPKWWGYDGDYHWYQQLRKIPMEGTQLIFHVYYELSIMDIFVWHRMITRLVYDLDEVPADVDQHDVTLYYASDPDDPEKSDEQNKEDNPHYEFSFSLMMKDRT